MAPAKLAELHVEDELNPQIIRWVDTTHWDAEPCPKREWAVLERIPLRQVSLFSGEGAIGKSIAEGGAELYSGRDPFR